MCKQQSKKHWRRIWNLHIKEFSYLKSMQLTIKDADDPSTLYAQCSYVKATTRNLFSYSWHEMKSFIYKHIRTELHD